MSAIAPTVNGIPAYKLQVRWTLGQPEDISYTIYGPAGAGLLAGQAPPNGGILPVTFDGTTVPVLRLTPAQAQTTDMCASCTFKGGDAHHGLPTTGKITDLAVLANGMALVAVYGQIDVGGVFYWPGDGSLYAMSQAMGANSLWLSGGDYGEPRLYAATDAGVYWALTDVPRLEPWARLGAMSLRCLKVMRQAGIVYCLAEFAGSGDRHILQYTPGTTDGLGYDDWTSLVSASGITDFVATSTPTATISYATFPASSASTAWTAVRPRARSRSAPVRPSSARTASRVWAISTAPWPRAAPAAPCRAACSSRSMPSPIRRSTSRGTAASTGSTPSASRSTPAPISMTTSGSSGAGPARPTRASRSPSATAPTCWSPASAPGATSWSTRPARRRPGSIARRSSRSWRRRR